MYCTSGLKCYVKLRLHKEKAGFIYSVWWGFHFNSIGSSLGCCCEEISKPVFSVYQIQYRWNFN